MCWDLVILGLAHGHISALLGIISSSLGVFAEFYEIMVDLLCTTLRTDDTGALDTNVTADDIALEVTGNRSAMHLSPQEVSIACMLPNAKYKQDGCLL
jgi:hypothetical protein